MALSLSGDDEEYDSESEQVRAPHNSYMSSLRVCFLTIDIFIYQSVALT